jgi:hypothetical protein
MGFANLGELRVEITRLAMREGDDSFAAGIPGMVTLAESIFNYGMEDRPQIRTGDMITTATITLTNGLGDLPADYLQSVVSESSLGRGLAPSTRRWNDPNFHSPYVLSYGQPNRIYIEGSKVRVSPSGAASVDLTYYAKIPPLVDDADSNWLLAKHPGVYLFGTLIFGGVYMEDDAAMARFGTIYNGMTAGFITADTKARTANTAIYAQGVTP